MAIRRRRHKHGPKDRQKHVEELSKQLAPLEELMPDVVKSAPHNDYHDATIRVDNASVRLPESFLESDERKNGNGVFHFEPVVIAICLIMLAWAMFITYQIAQMPPKP